MFDAETLMRLAIDKALEGVAAGQSPFGCAIARGEEILAVEHNVVLATTDITAHAEITAIRSACRQVNNIFLEECVVATTCEPCPMCMAALHWARVKTVYYGATIDDAAQAGFNEISLPAAEIVNRASPLTKRQKLNLQSNVLREECRQLFEQWRQNPNRSVY